VSEIGPIRVITILRGTDDLKLFELFVRMILGLRECLLSMEQSLSREADRRSAGQNSISGLFP
jgi:hypothetical protein